MIVSCRCKGVMLDPARSYSECVEKPAWLQHQRACTYVSYSLANAIQGNHAASLCQTCTVMYLLWAGVKLRHLTKPPLSVWPACCFFHMCWKHFPLMTRKSARHSHTPAPAERPPWFVNPLPSASLGKVSGRWFPLLSHPACLSAERLIAAQSLSFSFRCSSI